MTPRANPADSPHIQLTSKRNATSLLVHRKFSSIDWLRVIRDQRILIVEDDLELWPVLERVSCLVDPGIKIDFEETAEGAVSRLVNETRYSVVLVDRLLPGDHDGGWLRLRCERFQPWANFAMMSSSPASVLEGNVAFLAKPFSISQCKHFLHELVH